VDKSQAPGHSGHYILYDGASAGKLFYITRLAPKIVRFFLDSWKIYAQLGFGPYHIGKMWEIFMKTCCICNYVVAKATMREIYAFPHHPLIMK